MGLGMGLGPALGAASVGPPTAVVGTSGATAAVSLGVVVVVPPATVAEEASVGGAARAPGVGAPLGTAKNSPDVDFGCTIVPPVFQSR